MRYIFISDVHGCYNKMITALNKVNFNAEVDTIVSLGDPFDRGPDSYEVLKFLMTCPHRILIWGNHDLRFKELLLHKDDPNGCDYHNGMLETLKSFCDNQNITSVSLGLFLLQSDPDRKMRYDLLWNYFHECHFAAEWSDIVTVHGWLPYLVTDTKVCCDEDGIPYSKDVLSYWTNWRDAYEKDWINATWSNTEDCVINEIFPPDKKIIVGHWHAFRLRNLLNNAADDDDGSTDFSTFEYKDKLVALDGCSNAANGLVNAWVYESDEMPQLIR